MVFTALSKQYKVALNASHKFRSVMYMLNVITVSMNLMQIMTTMKRKM